MLIALAGFMAIVAFTVLMRLLWLSSKPTRSTTLITIAAVTLIIGLAVLAATGRMHWIAALGAAILPFLRRILSSLRYLPFLKGAYGTFRQAQGDHQGPQSKSGDSRLSLDEARQILGLGSHPTKEEIIAAHRSLMQKLHPDRGGTTYLAQQLNEAKRVLLKSQPK